MKGVQSTNFKWSSAKLQYGKRDVDLTQFFRQSQASCYASQDSIYWKPNTEIQCILDTCVTTEKSHLFFFKE